MKITIIYDNETDEKDLKSDWGFSCLVEVWGRKLLFDTGANGSILLGNMKKLNIESAAIKEVFISHPGVKSILRAASQFGKTEALIGGLHGFSDFDVIKDLKLICPTHCTQFKSQIRSLYPEKYVKGGVGKVIEI